MARTIDLESHVRQLVEEKQKHVDALSHINQTLDHIRSLMNGSAQLQALETEAGPPVASEPTGAPTDKRKRRRRQFDMTAADFILSFVKQQKKPTTREINARWKSEGRPFTADVTLGKLVKEKKLKRTPLVGERGSRYSVA
jgi:hypothetical protein